MASTLEILLAAANSAKNPESVGKKPGGNVGPFMRGGSGGRDMGAYGTPKGGSIPVRSMEEGQALAAKQGRSEFMSSLLKPRYGPARLEEVGPMFMKNRYGPEMLNHMGPMDGAGRPPTTAPQGLGQLFQGMVGGQGLARTEAGGADGIQKPEGMDALEWATLLATLAQAGGSIYSGVKQGQAADREYEDRQKRRKDNGALLGSLFRDRLGGS